VPSAGQKCLTIKSSGIALHDNDDMVSLNKRLRYVIVLWLDSSYVEIFLYRKSWTFM